MAFSSSALSRCFHRLKTIKLLYLSFVLLLSIFVLSHSASAGKVQDFVRPFGVVVKRKLFSFGRDLFYQKPPGRAPFAEPSAQEVWGHKKKILFAARAGVGTTLIIAMAATDYQKAQQITNYLDEREKRISEIMASLYIKAIGRQARLFFLPTLKMSKEEEKNDDVRITISLERQKTLDFHHQKAQEIRAYRKYLEDEIPEQLKSLLFYNLGNSLIWARSFFTTDSKSTSTIFLNTLEYQRQRRLLDLQIAQSFNDALLCLERENYAAAARRLAEVVYYYEQQNPNFTREKKLLEIEQYYKENTKESDREKVVQDDCSKSLTDLHERKKVENMLLEYYSSRESEKRYNRESACSSLPGNRTSICADRLALFHNLWALALHRQALREAKNDEEFFLRLFDPEELSKREAAKSRLAPETSGEVTKSHSMPETSEEAAKSRLVPETSEEAAKSRLGPETSEEVTYAWREILLALSYSYSNPYVYVNRIPIELVAIKREAEHEAERKAKGEDKREDQSQLSTRKKRAQKATNIMERLSPNDPAVLNAVGLYYTEGKLDKNKAEHCFTRALTLLPNNPAVLHNLAKLCLEQKRFREAYEHAYRANLVKPYDSHILWVLVQAAAKSKKHKEFEEYSETLKFVGETDKYVGREEIEAQLQKLKEELNTNLVTFLYRKFIK